MFCLFVAAMVLIATLLTSTKANAQSAENTSPAPAASTTSAKLDTLKNDPATLAVEAEAQAELNSKPFRYTGELLIETARTADEAQPASYTGWYRLTTSATHAASSISAILRLGYTREYTYERADGSNGDFDNPILTLSKSFLNGEHYNFVGLDSLSVAVIGSLPVSRESERRTFRGSSGVLLTGTKALGRFTVQQAFGYSRGFYEYDIRDDGTVNSPDSLKSLTLVNYGITDRFSVGAMFTYVYAISFQGVGRGTQLGAVTADYAFTDNIAATLGVMSERATIEPDGQSDRIRVYAPEAAQYFADLVLKL